MPKILVVEGNPPELALDRRRAVGATTAQDYAAALHEVAPALDVEIAQPMFSDHNADAIDFASFDGMAVTGSGVSWSAADERAAPYWEMYERAFKAGTPVFGCCWGMQNAAVVLGGETKAGPNGVEAGFARAVSPTDHPMHAGRRESFDVICMHRDDVTRAPEGAIITATNDHTGIQAFAFDQGEVSFWGVQYHPEATVKDVGYWFSRSGPAEGNEKRTRAGKEIARIAEDPVFHANAAAKHRVGVDILDRAYHLTEIRNWLNAQVL